MRVKLLIALALATIFLLAGSSPAWAIGTPGPSGVVVNVPSTTFVPAVTPASVVPCVSFPALSAPAVAPCGPVAPIDLCPPAIAAAITLSGPCTPGFISPSFVLPNLFPASITAFQCTAPVLFDP